MEHETQIAADEPSDEREPISIDLLLEKLGFVETPEMAELRVQIIEQLKTGEFLEGLTPHDYRLLAEPAIDTLVGEARARAQIGLIVKIARMLLAAGRDNEYREDLEEARQYAKQMGLKDIMSDLEVEFTNLPQPQQA